MAKEYIFKQDAWGNWKLVPKEDDTGFGCLIAGLFFIILTAVVLILPFLSALMGFKMTERKRYWAGIFSLATFIYFLFDVSNKWLTSIWFFGFTSSTGEFTNGIFDEQYLIIVFIINVIGLFIGSIFTLRSLATTKLA